MSAEDSIPTRLKAGLPGLGEASETDIQRRAEELARSDGRDSFTDADLTRAAAELSGANSAPDAPEATDVALGEMTTWDDPVDQAGHQVSAVPLEDEVSAAELLVQDGLEEADHSTRNAAAEEAEDTGS